MSDAIASAGRTIRRGSTWVLDSVESADTRAEARPSRVIMYDIYSVHRVSVSVRGASGSRVWLTNVAPLTWGGVLCAWRVGFARMAY